MHTDDEGTATLQFILKGYANVFACIERDKAEANTGKC